MLGTLDYFRREQDYHDHDKEGQKLLKDPSPRDKTSFEKDQET